MAIRRTLFSNETGTHCYGAVLSCSAQPSSRRMDRNDTLYFQRTGGRPQSAIFDRSGTCMLRCGGPLGFGVIFQLTPPLTAPGRITTSTTSRCPDGAFVVNGLAMDPARNIYGATLGGGNGVPGDGSVFELQPPASQGGPWTESVLYTFAMALWAIRPPPARFSTARAISTEPWTARSLQFWRGL